MTPVCFYKEDIPNSSIATLKRAEVVLLGACEAIETAIKKNLKDGRVDQSSERDDNEAFFPENLKSKNGNKSNEDNELDTDLDDANSDLDKIAVCYIP